jgi:hypothetical protein
MVRECFVRCEVSAGMFSDEALVRIRAYDASGKIVSVTSIVPKQVIRVDESDAHRGLLKAHCMAQDDDQTSLVLPQDTLENGATVVVPSEEVVAAETQA